LPLASMLDWASLPEHDVGLESELAALEHALAHGSEEDAEKQLQVLERALAGAPAQAVNAEAGGVGAAVAAQEVAADEEEELLPPPTCGDSDSSIDV
jgi:hypothetical protein